MTESIVTLRLTRNLRYKLTYVKIFQSFLEAGTAVEVTQLLETLIETQQAAISALAAYLRRTGAAPQDLELNDKLISQAAERTDVKSQLRFIYDGLERAVAWYRMQLVDKQMATDPELVRLLIELGEMEAAKLWRTEAVMSILRVPVKTREREQEPQQPSEPELQEGWRPRLMDDVGRPSWSGQQPPRWSGPRKPRRRERP